MSVPHSFWTLGLVRDAVPWEALPLTGLAGSSIPVDTTASHSYGDLRNLFSGSHADIRSGSKHRTNLSHVVLYFDLPNDMVANRGMAYVTFLFCSHYPRIGPFADSTSDNRTLHRTPHRTIPASDPIADRTSDNRTSHRTLHPTIGPHIHGVPLPELIIPAGSLKSMGGVP